MSFFSILTTTPWWVMAIWVYIVVQAGKALFTHQNHVTQLFLLPVMIAALQYRLFFGPTHFFIWLYFAVCISTVLVSFFVSAWDESVTFHRFGMVTLQPQYRTAGILLGFAFVRLLLHAVHVEVQDTIYAYVFVGLQVALVAVSSGYFLGRALAYVFRSIFHTG